MTKNKCGCFLYTDPEGSDNINDVRIERCPHCLHRDKMWPKMLEMLEAAKEDYREEKCAAADGAADLVAILIAECEKVTNASN